jgi:hypothetical protein
MFPSVAFITDFSMGKLSGWGKQRIVVSNSADPRAMDFDFLSTVLHNFPSHWHSRFPTGYIQFANGKRFCRTHQTIKGVRKYLFRLSLIENYWILFVELQRLLKILAALDDSDFFAAVELVIEAAALGDRRAPCLRPLANVEVQSLLPHLGLRTIRSLCQALDAVPSTGRETDAAA